MLLGKRPTTPVRAPAPRTQPPEPVALSTMVGSRSVGPDGVKLRRLHDVEVMLQEREERLLYAESRITQQHLEIQRLRNQLDSRDKDVQYVHRLLERARSDAGRMASEVKRLQAEIDAHKAMVEGEKGPAGDRARTSLRTRSGTPRRGLFRSYSAGHLSGLKASSGSGSTGNSQDKDALSERRCAWLEGRLAQEQEAMRVQKRETTRLQREVSELKEALETRGEPAISAHELIVSRGETMQLALDLHEAKEAARQAHDLASAESRRCAAAEERIVELEARASLAERSADEASREAHERSEKMAKLRADNDAMLDHVQDLVAELASTESVVRELREAKLDLAERLNEVSHERATAETELRRRTDEFEMELGLIAEKNRELGKEVQACRTELRSATVRAEQAMQEANASRRELQESRREASNLCCTADELAAANTQLRSDYETAAAKVQAQAEELSKIGSHLSVIRESTDSQHTMLTERLQVALKELHTTIHERDRLRAALDEALTSCAGAVVAQQVAEASQGELQKQLAEVRQQLVTIHDSRSHR